MSPRHPSGAKARGAEAFEECRCKVECVAIALWVTGNQRDRLLGEEMLLHPDHELLPVNLPCARYRQKCAVRVATEEVFLAKDAKLSGRLVEHLDDLVALKGEGHTFGRREAGNPEVKPLIWCNEFAPLQASSAIEFVGLVNIELAGRCGEVGLSLAGGALGVLTCSVSC